MKKVVGVNFISGSNTRKMYSFYTDLELKKDDIVVCDTAYGYGIAKVVEENILNGQAKKWIIDRVNIDKHLERLAKEEKIKRIKGKMLQRKKQLEEKAIWEMLAKKDPEIARLLKELENLEN